MDEERAPLEVTSVPLEKHDRQGTEQGGRPQRAVAGSGDRSPLNFVAWLALFAALSAVASGYMVFHQQGLALQAAEADRAALHKTVADMRQALELTGRDQHASVGSLQRRLDAIEKAGEAQHIRVTGLVQRQDALDQRLKPLDNQLATAQKSLDEQKKLIARLQSGMAELAAQEKKLVRLEDRLQGLSADRVQDRQSLAVATQKISGLDSRIDRLSGNMEGLSQRFTQVQTASEKAGRVSTDVASIKRQLALIPVLRDKQQTQDREIQSIRSLLQPEAF
jgi:chromosome segregation ATPase